MTEKKPIHKGVYVLPNLLTTGSLFCGFLSMTMAIDGRFDMAAMLILISAVLDGLDGKVARFTGTTSDFGIQYDSLADLVAFGVAPAIMSYQWFLKDFGRLGLLAAFLMIACGALRLARFNVMTTRISKKFFIGLPIPAAGCTLATLVLFSTYLPTDVALKSLPTATLILVYLLSFLMVSTIRYASFKESDIIKAHPFSAAVSAILVFVLIASWPMFLGFIFFLLYIISGPIYTFLFLLPRSKMLREPSQELS